MKFNVSSAFIAVLAACASSVFAQSVDWNSADVQACAQKNWAAIKQQVDVKIAANWQPLPSFIKDAVKQSGALNADNTLVSNPTGAQLIALATSFPSGIFNPYAENIVQQCLTATPSETETEEPSTSSEEPSTSSEEPSTSSEEPSTSSEEPSTSSEEPSTSSEEPSTSSEEPSQSEEESEVPSQSEETSESASQSDETSESASESQEESESSTEEPTSSAPDTTAEPSSTPVKCIPRH
ncbi:hypothetical protein IW147_001911 [Coemansia sp. RSA 720]|nr:hypothetical protein IW147_001911 [Coemansia sp. RSA 720]